MNITQAPTKLIIVPGHASFKSTVDPMQLPDDVYVDELWCLFPYQIGEIRLYTEHIKKGIDLLHQAEHDTLLVFSGGVTRPESGRWWSEARSYLAVAQHEGWLPASDNMLTNVTLDEFARDSLENIVGSIYAFYKKTGEFPTHVTVVSWIIRQERYDHYVRMLNIPPEKFQFVGVNNPPENSMPEALAGEQRVMNELSDDPLGQGPLLSAKRSERDPLDQGNPYGSMPPIQM